ncbi:MAG: UDP-N-acetylmuramoyl-L-alanyl-D-glutamate--2,6-diaminopimelate ligase [Spirochaetes bacterium]|jgi:UDP-N-acetylmuramoyl-L-alanyl-D-glutamate--2,6-diaminopimelate ligase|nr:UDP-N-acetylmuramoyl-L-alanyl-D-glutamate--2,6-diaminopimelate ligase [Spirochaetota bacterium]
MNKNHANKTLGDVIAGTRGAVSLYSGGGDVLIGGIEYDSRKVVPGSLFVAVKGFRTDGHDYVEKAVSMGAVAVLASGDRAEEISRLGGKGIPVVSYGDQRKAMSSISASFFGRPSREMLMIGVTGTNGKTSITYMLESILACAGFTPGIIGTVNYRWKGKSIPAPNTTPESRDLQEILREMRNDGVDAAVMEVSSHALELNRADDIDFDAAIFTNLTGDHLDFHLNMENYYSAKRRFFDLMESSDKKTRVGVVNGDDEYGMRIIADRVKFTYRITDFGLKNGAHYGPEKGSIKNEISGLHYFLGSPERAEIRLKLAGRFHVYNSLAAVAAARELGIPMEKIVSGLSGLKAVPGRFDVLSSGNGFSVIVDYAHTGDALLKLLQSVREVCRGKIITVFGCGGDRDRTKRPVMGAIASENSDFVIVTSDNPRTEKPLAIIDEIRAGISGNNYEVIQDRTEAIGRAVFMGRSGDVIVIAGKGHEDYQIIGTEKIHFDDRETAVRFMSERRAG